MKQIISILFLCSCTIGYSQDYPPKTKHIKTINVTVYKKKDTVEHKKLFTYYDKDWKILTNTNTLPSALKKGTKTVTIINTDRHVRKAVINAENDTISYTVFLNNKDGKRTNRYQILKNGDTVNDQKRTYDKHGNNTKLFNKKDGAYFLRYEAEFNEDNKKTVMNWYNPAGQLIRITKSVYSNNGKTESYYTSDRTGAMLLQTKTTEIAPKKYKMTYYQDHSGINYGITLVWKKGYYTIKEEDENGNVEKLEIFDKRKRLTTSIYVTYKEVE